MSNLLAVPGAGFVATSVNVHRSDVVIVADWVEATALFFNRPISKMEVRDFLCDNDYYEDQDFAMTFVDMLWGELTVRTSWIKPSLVFNIDTQELQPLLAWKDALGYAFCLMLTHLQRYSSIQYPTLHSRSYVSQGSLFERFSEESLVKLGWKTLRTGWASGITNPSFKQIIDTVAKELDEDWINGPAAAVFKDAKEEGLDIVIHLPFKDSRVGRAYFLVQCASGGNWQEKLHTPRIEVWNKLIVFTTDPRRAFCFPLALDDDGFRATCAKCTGLLLDRYRLLSSGTGLTANLSDTLRDDLIKWLDPRVSALPTV